MKDISLETSEVLHYHEVRHVVKVFVPIKSSSATERLKVWIEDVLSMTRRVHPELDHGLRKGEVSMRGNNFALGSKGIRKLTGRIGRIDLPSRLILKAMC